MNTRLPFSPLLAGLLFFFWLSPNAAQTLESSNLPILVVETGGQLILDEPKITVHLGVLWHADGSRNYLDEPFDHYDGLAGIEIRGSSSQLFPKKGYALELRAPDSTDLDWPLLGLPAESDWVLHGPFSDKSLMRNALAYKMAGRLMRWAPRTRFCELIIDGDYRGVYLLVEKIKRDKHRVDISKLKPDENSGDDLTGGYILKIDKEEGAEVGGWYSEIPSVPGSWQRTFFQYHYPKPSEITLTQQAYIRLAVQRWENALAAPDFDDTTGGWRRYMDETSLIDFFLVQEMAKNVDAYRLSTFFYKDKDSVDPRFFMGPVWDFNLGFGNVDYCEMASTPGWVATGFNQICPGDYWAVPFWWNRLFADKAFKKRVKERWQHLRQGPLHTDSLMACIDSMAALLSEAQQRNFQRFPILDQYVWPNSYVGGSWQAEVLFLKFWLQARLAWMDGEIDRFDAPEYHAEDYFAPTASPNPSHGPVTFRYYVRQTELVRIHVYDALGREVAVLRDYDHPNGANALEWEGPGQTGWYVYVVYLDDRPAATGKLLIL